MKLEEEKKDEAKTLLVKLKTPVPWNDSEVTEIQFKEPKGNDVKNISFSNLTVGSMLEVCQKCSPYPQKFFEDHLSGRDAFTCQKVMTDFLTAE